MFDTTYIFLHSVLTKEGGGGNNIYHIHLIQTDKFHSRTFTDF